MKVRFANADTYRDILAAVKRNDGYCPCRLEHTDDTKCICAEFRGAPSGETCHCGLYFKEEA